MRRIAGIDVHKRILIVVVLSASGAGDQADERFGKRRFGTTTSELLHLAAWLQAHGVEEVVMESTARYWKPVWLALEPHFRLCLAQAWSNRAPQGKKTDFKDAQRLVRRHMAGELTLSFVPDAEQRLMRSLTRRRTQLTHDRVRIQNQVESLLEETRIKISSVVTDLFGSSGLRILSALSEGETDPAKLAALADARVQRSTEELADALTGTVSEIHQKLLRQHLNHRKLVEAQMEEVSRMAADSMREHSDAVARLIGIPGIRVLSAQAAVRTKNSFFEQKFRRLLPRLGYTKAIWAIARHLSVVIWKVLHEGVQYIEYGLATSPQAAKRRLQRIKRELLLLGYSDDLKPLATEAVRC